MDDLVVYSLPLTLSFLVVVHRVSRLNKTKNVLYWLAELTALFIKTKKPLSAQQSGFFGYSEDHVDEVDMTLFVLCNKIGLSC
ncbi:hypothetical protein [Endozoicomonas lisbonensis]|uniref:Uncharacterized protein n=1 Tax=Endozoicomonas lisbonensis TaxID=3120522 RepID=A0ABV2SCW4_9GAMM